MENRQLFVNGVSVDFFDDEPIPLILGVNDLGDLQSLQGNISKQFKLPLTQKNREVFGFPDDITITDNTPYTQLPAKYIQDGIEIVANGLVEVQYTQNNAVNVILLFGNIDFLDRLGGQIYDMGDSTSIWSGYGANKVWDQYSLPNPSNLLDLNNCIWDVPHAAYSQNKTSGWIWPVVNYGDIDTTPPFAGHINVRNIRPGFFLHSAIELLVQSTGYTINYAKSCIYNDPVFADLYQKLIIQFSNSDFEHGSDWQNTPDNLGVTLYNGQDQIISRSRADLTRHWNQSDIYQNDNPFSNVITFGPSDHYTVLSGTVSFTATVHFDLFMKGRFTGTPSQVIVKFTVVNADGSMFDAASTTYIMDESATRFGSGSGSHETRYERFLNQKLTQDFTFTSNMKLYVRVHINNIGLQAENPQNTYVIFYKNASLSIVTSEKTTLWQQPIQCERLLPNVGMLDLLKDTLQRFGLILISDPNSGTITFTSFKVIVANIPNARDWSGKCKDMGKQNAFKIGNYSQVNFLRYQQDSSIPVNYMPLYFADDQIDISDKTLNPTQPTQELFTSIFAPTINTPYLGGTMAQISDPTSTEEFSVGGQPRLLIDNKLNLLNAGPGGNPLNITFSDGDSGFENAKVVINDTISVPYFYKSDGDYNLAWTDLPGKGGATLPGLKTQYFQELINILTQSKKVTRYFYLTPADILDFDFTIPVYIRQDGAYYYVSKIDSWVKGQPCKVDLVQIAK